MTACLPIICCNLIDHASQIYIIIGVWKRACRMRIAYKMQKGKDCQSYDQWASSIASVDIGDYV